MSETVEATTPAKPSDECKAEIAKSVTVIRKLSAEEALSQLNDFRAIENKEPVDGEANEAWVKKNLRYAIQAQILEKHGCAETARVRANRAATEEEDPTKTPEKRPGRKRINTSGTFRLVLGEPENLGREGSAKGTILRHLKTLGEEFTYDQFRDAVVLGYSYNSETETFEKETRFPTIQAATSAWFSELKNKNGLITQDSENAPEA
jgi:phage terminase large subunit-like protein